MPDKPGDGMPRIRGLYFFQEVVWIGLINWQEND